MKEKSQSLSEDEQRRQALPIIARYYLKVSADVGPVLLGSPEYITKRELQLNILHDMYQTDRPALKALGDFLLWRNGQRIERIKRERNIVDYDGIGLA